MFRDEKVYLINIKEDKSLKLESEDGKALALIFIKDGNLIIRSDGLLEETKIKSPEIKTL